MEQMVIHCRQWRILNASNGANGTPHHHWCQWLLSLAPLMIAIGQHWCHLNGDNGDVAARIVIKRKAGTIGDNGDPLVISGDNGSNGDNG